MIIILLLTACLLLSPFSIYSKDTFDFALDLYNNSDYYRAISEFKRFTFYYPDSNKLKNAYLYIVKSYYYAGQYDQAITEIENNKDKIRDKIFQEQFDLFLAKSYLYLGKDSVAFKIYQTLENNTTSNEIREQASYGLIWTRIFGMKWRNAHKYLNQFQKAYPEANSNSESSLLMNDIKKGLDFSPLSPTLAVIMSTVIPGSGQVYCKRIGDGFVALIFISLLSFGTYYYHDNGPEGMFYGFAILDAIFYLGNIYTAYGSAHKYNKNFNETLKTELINSYSY